MYQDSVKYEKNTAVFVIAVFCFSSTFAIGKTIKTKDMQTVKLNNGIEMPILGYGVFQVSPAECERCVADALKVGYIAKSGIDRKEIFLVSKIWMSNYGYEKAKASIDESLRKLKTDYIDLMLLHQPFNDYYGAYRALEEAYKAGKLRAIGVSNFYPDRLIDIAHNAEIVPAVNQVETHVFQQQVEAKKYMDEMGCQIMAWGPLAEGKNGFFTNETLINIGKKYGKTGPQVALRYLTQRGVVVIPKSTHVERMEQNLNIFDFTLTDEDITEILKLDTGKPVVMPSHHNPEIVKYFMQMLPK